MPTKLKHRIIRDPVYDYISIDPEDHLVWELLCTSEVQRLRDFHQLGMSYLVYPGAVHTRLAHSLGVFHLMKQVVGHLKIEGIKLEKQAKEGLLAAALLHDVGHGPFSHVLERKLGGSHEKWSYKIVTDDRTQVHKILQEHDIVEIVASLIDEEGRPDRPWLKHLISSQIDVDRMDYLLRDSCFCGVGYGKFDYYRLIHTMRLGYFPRREAGQSEAEKCLIWPEKAKYAIEEYIFARYYMYLAVYFHHTTRGYEKLLEAIWERAVFLQKEGANLDAAQSLTPFFGKGEPTVEEYLRLREYHVLAQIEIWSHWPDTKDAVLPDLCRMFLDRKGFKTIELKKELKGFEAVNRLGEVLDYFGKVEGKERHFPKGYIREDETSVVPYQPYLWEEKETQQPKQPILLNCAGNVKEITQELERLRPITKKTEEITRYYCPEEHLEAVKDILECNAGP